MRQAAADCRGCGIWGILGRFWTFLPNILAKLATSPENVGAVGEMSQNVAPKKRNVAKYRLENGENTRIGSVFTIYTKTILWPGCGRLRQAAAGCRGCGKLRQAVAGCGRLRQAAAGCGWLRQAAAGCGRLWQAAAGCGRLRRAAASCRGLRTTGGG